ncbi:hypothetical protein WA158_000731 [Blastocystis sp. Blastoise]
MWLTKIGRLYGICLLCGNKIKCDCNGCLQSASIEKHLRAMHGMKLGIFKQYGTIQEYFDGFHSDKLPNENRNSILMYCNKKKQLEEDDDDENEIVCLQTTTAPPKRPLQLYPSHPSMQSNKTISSTNGKRRCTITLSPQYSISDAECVLFMCKNRISFQIMKIPDSTQYLNFISYYRATIVINSLTIDLQEYIKEQLKNVIYYSLSSDIWSRHNKKIISWNYYYFDKDGYHSGLYSLLPVKSSTAQDILESLNKIIPNNNLVSVTTDKAQGYNAAFSSNNHFGLIKIDCFSHFLNTVYTHAIGKPNTKELFAKIRSLIQEIRLNKNYDGFCTCVQAITGTKPRKPCLDCPTRFYSILAPLQWIYQYGAYAISYLNNIKNKCIYDNSLICEFCSFIPYLCALNKSHLMLSCYSKPTVHLILPFINELSNMFNKSPADVIGYESSFICINEFVQSVRYDFGRIGTGNFYYNNNQLDFLSCSSSLYLFLSNIMKRSYDNNQKESSICPEIEKWRKVLNDTLCYEKSINVEIVIKKIETLRNACVDKNIVPISEILLCEFDKRDEKYLQLVDRGVKFFFLSDATNHNDYINQYRSRREKSVSILNTDKVSPLESINNNITSNDDIVDNNDYCDDYDDLRFETSLFNAREKYFNCSVGSNSNNNSILDEEELSSSDEEFYEFYKRTSDSYDNEDDNQIFTIPECELFTSEKKFNIDSDIKYYFSFDLYFNEFFYDENVIRILSRFLSPPATEIGDERVFSYSGLLDNGRNTNMKSEKFCGITYISRNEEMVLSMLKSK